MAACVVVSGCSTTEMVVVTTSTTTPLTSVAELEPATGAGQGSAGGDRSMAEIEVTPADDVAALVAEARPGARFRFRAGEYRGLSIEPGDRMTFLADPGVVLTGAAFVEGFVAEEGVWTASSPVPVRTDPVAGEEWGYCDDDRPACVFPEDLFIDGVALQRRLPSEPVGPGEWSIDPVSGRIVLGDDPNGRLVELSHVPYAFHGEADEVTISGFVIERYATPGRQGAINPRVGRIDGAGIDWVVSDNVVRWSHGWGVKLEDGMDLVGNILEFNGQGGIGGVAEHVVVADNQVIGNCTAGYRCFGWEGGGMKLHVDDAAVTGNLVADNLGHGIHTDIGCERVVIEANLVRDNLGAGIHHEISGSAVIRGNVVTGNGFAPGRPEEPGILVLSSSEVEVVGNLIDGNALGVVLRQDERVEDGILSDVTVIDNTIRSDGGPAMVMGGSPGEGFTGEWATGLVIDANHYILGGGVTVPFRWEGVPATIEEWQTVGNDADGVFELSS